MESQVKETYHKYRSISKTVELKEKVSYNEVMKHISSELIRLQNSHRPVKPELIK